MSHCSTKPLIKIPLPLFLTQSKEVLEPVVNCYRTSDKHSQRTMIASAFLGSAIHYETGTVGKLTAQKGV